MSGEFTRTFDSDCMVLSRSRESVGPAHYKMSYDQNVNCDPCLNQYGSVPNKYLYLAKNKNQVDIESVLQGSTYNYIGCGNRDAVRLISPAQGQNQNINPTCNKWLTPQDTLMTTPKSYYTELQIDRFYDLERPNYSEVFFDTSVNTRLAAKDSHITRFPVPISLNPSLTPAQRTPRNDF